MRARPRRRHRPRPAGAGARGRAARAVRRPLHRRARGVRRDPRRAGRPRASTTVDARAVRPRRLLAAARRRRARLRLPRGRARSTCGWTAPPDRPRPTSSTPTRPPTWPGCSRSTARSGSPARSPAPSSGPARRAPFTTSARLVELLYDAIPAPGAAYRRPPGQAHLPGAADGGQRRARRAAPGAARRHRRDRASAAAWSWSPTTRWRTGSSSRRSPTATRSDVPDDLPFVPEGHEPAFRLVTRGAERADAAEIDHNPRAASVRLRAVERLAPSPCPRSRPEMSSPNEQPRLPDQVRPDPARRPGGFRRSPAQPSSGPGSPSSRGRRTRTSPCRS